jgi:hypothetical protein
VADSGIFIEKFVIAGEVGFEISHKGYRVRAWTGCARKIVKQCDWMPSSSFEIVVGRPAGEDAGWILVIDDASGRVQYFARKVLRTENFVKNFLERARITWKRIFHRPECECHRLFELFQDKEAGDTFWRCYQKNEHAKRKQTREDWNFCLTAEERKTVREWGRSRRRSRKKTQALRAAQEAASVSIDSSKASP